MNATHAKPSPNTSPLQPIVRTRPLHQASPLRALPDPINADIDVTPRDGIGGLLHEYAQVSLGETDRRYLDFERAFVDRVVAQCADEKRELTETFDRVWQALAALPRRELTMIDADALDAHHRENAWHRCPAFHRAAPDGCAYAAALRPPNAGTTRRNRTLRRGPPATRHPPLGATGSYPHRGPR